LTEPRAAGEADRALGGLSIICGVIHTKALSDHVSHSWVFGAFFGIVACAQVVWGLRAYRGGLSSRALVVGAWANLALVVIWAISRTVGMPFGPWAGEAEAIGLTDVMATIDELATVVLVVALVTAQAGAARLSWLHGAHAVRLAMMLGSASLFATAIGGHTH
jgi:hypothetical protein